MLFRGEGMCSPKVTPGTAAAFAGLTPSLRKFRIPAECASDGPSGIRMDCGTKAFSLPNGTLLGCTFNCELVRQLYEMTGLELRLNRVDTLLGPGLNIHRNPLNGRNFEYISEDPFLTGKWEPHSCRDLILQVPQEPSNILRQTIRKRNDMRQIRLFPCGHCGKFI